MSTAGWIAGTAAVGLVAGGAVAHFVGRRRSAKDLPSITDDPTITPVPIEPSSTWQFRTAHDAGYPWNAPVMHVENWPTPGMWVDIGDFTGDWDPSNGLDSLVRAILGSALSMAGNDPEIATAEGQDPNALLGRTLRKQVRDSLVNPGGINDSLYGQTNANFAGGVDPGKPCVHGSSGAPCEDGIRDPNANGVTYMMNPDGRGLNWLPRHPDNVMRIEQGLAPARGTNVYGVRLGNDSSHMLIYVPAYDLALLGPDQATPKIGYLKWPDGSSTADPPPAVRALGVDMSGVELPVS